MGFQSASYWPIGGTGPAGPAGPTGPQGNPGPGVATGGTTGQSLVKTSSTDFDTHWATVGGGNSIRYGTFASLPVSSASVGDMYKCTDAPYEFIWTGAAWQAYCFGFAVTIPALTSFAWVNQGSATVDETRGYIYIQSDSAAGTNARVRQTAGAGATFSVYAAFQVNSFNKNALAGFGMRESATGKMMFVGWDGFSLNDLVIRPYTSPTSVGGLTVDFDSPTSVCGPLVFFKLVYDGTNVTLSASITGDIATQYVQIYTGLATTFFTVAPNEAVILVDNEGNALSQHALNVLHFAMTTP